MSTSNHGRHWDSLTSEKLLKEIQRIPIQRGDGKGSFANRSKTLQGSNYANCIFFLVKTCFLNLASSSVHSVLPPKGVHIAKVSPFQSKSKQFRPFIRNHGTTMIPQDLCAELKHSILHFFSAVGFRAAIGAILSVF